MSKKRILIIYDYFLPGYNAGGPVQSLANMISLLHDDFEFFVITSAYDVNARQPYANIVINGWNDLRIKDTVVKVWYKEKGHNYKKITAAIKSVNADFIYMNCMYSIPLFVYPIFFIKKIFSRDQSNIIISPRGILQPGSLAVKPLKKKIYLALLRLSGILKKCRWHATSKDEAESIYRYFRKNSSIEILSNIPKQPVKIIPPPTKEKNYLKLVHLSLIAPVKNILGSINALAICKARIELDIYGPIKDTDYWQECIKAMQNIPANLQINYKGDVQPDNVQTTLQQYDAMILLTKGENFGHALFESLSVGRPIITSHFTPWNALAEKKAGWNVDINDQKSIVDLLDSLAGKTNEEWMQYCKEAHQLAANYFEEQHFKESYRKLFV